MDPKRAELLLPAIVNILLDPVPDREGEPGLREVLRIMDDASVENVERCAAQSKRIIKLLEKYGI